MLGLSIFGRTTSACSAHEVVKFGEQTQTLTRVPTIRAKLALTFRRRYGPLKASLPVYPVFSFQCTKAIHIQHFSRTCVSFVRSICGIFLGAFSRGRVAEKTSVLVDFTPAAWCAFFVTRKHQLRMDVCTSFSPWALPGSASYTIGPRVTASQVTAISTAQEAEQGRAFSANNSS